MIWNGKLSRPMLAKLTVMSVTGMSRLPAAKVSGPRRTRRAQVEQHQHCDKQTSDHGLHNGRESIAKRPRPRSTKIAWETGCPVLSTFVTGKEQLLQLVERLPDDQVEELLRIANDLFAETGRVRRLPAFVGIGDSGRSDVSERADGLPSNGFGR